MDETREQLFREKQMRGESRQTTTEQDLYDAVEFRAALARQFYVALRNFDFTREEAVMITAGQHF